MKNLLKFGLPLLVVGLGLAMYSYNKPHENMDRAAADIAVSATELFTQFSADEAKANTDYLDKVVEIKGVVKEVSKNANGMTKVTLDSGDDMFGVICQLDELSEHQRTDFQTGEAVIFKGKCTGMLMDVVLVRCVEIKERSKN